MGGTGENKMRKEGEKNIKMSQKKRSQKMIKKKVFKEKVTKK